MAIDKDAFAKMKALVESKKSAADRASGAFDAAMSALHKDFGCKTIEAAQEKAEELQQEADSAEQAYNKKLADYKAKWKERLEE